MNGDTSSLVLGVGVAVGIAAGRGRRSGETPRYKARIAAGIALIVVAPLVSFLLILAPIKGFAFIVVLVPGAIVLYGVFLIVVGVAERRVKMPHGVTRL